MHYCIDLTLLSYGGSSVLDIMHYSAGLSPAVCYPILDTGHTFLCLMTYSSANIQAWIFYVFSLILQCCCCCCAHNLQLILSIRQRLTRGVGGYSRKFKSLNILWPRCCSHFWLFLSSSNWPVSGWRNFRWSFITRFFFSKNVNAIVLY